MLLLIFNYYITNKGVQAVVMMNMGGPSNLDEVRL